MARSVAPFLFLLLLVSLLCAPLVRAQLVSSITNTIVWTGWANNAVSLTGGDSDWGNTVNGYGAPDGLYASVGPTDESDSLCLKFPASSNVIPPASYISSDFKLQFVIYFGPITNSASWRQGGPCNFDADMAGDVVIASSSTVTFTNNQYVGPEVTYAVLSDTNFGFRVRIEETNSPGPGPTPDTTVNVNTGQMTITQIVTTAITSVLPSSMAGPQGTVVTINGHFHALLVQTPCLCAFGATNVAVTAVSPTQITCVVPTGSGIVAFGLQCGTPQVRTALGVSWTYPIFDKFSIASISPTILGPSIPQNLTLVGPVNTVGFPYIGGTNSRIGLVSAVSTTCAGVAQITNMVSTLYINISPRPAAGAYKLCYTANNAATWILQAPIVTFVAASGTIVTGIEPAFSGEYAKPTLTLQLGANFMAMFSPLSRFGLSLNCAAGVITSGPPSTYNPSSTSVTVVLNNKLPNTTATTAPTLYSLCVAVETGVWTAQGALTFGVYSPKFITTMSPKALAEKQVWTTSITPIPIVAGLKFAFSPNGNCVPASEAQFQANRAASATYQIMASELLVTTPAPAPIQYFALCVSFDNGVSGSWLAPGITLAVTRISTNMLAGPPPPTRMLVQGTVEEVNVPGLLLGRDYRFQLTRVVNDCGVGNLCGAGGTNFDDMYPAVARYTTNLALPITNCNYDVTLWLCARVAGLGGDAFTPLGPQSAVMVVSSPNVGRVSITSAVVVGTGTTNTFTFSAVTTNGLNATVGFATTGLCDSTARVATSVYAASIPGITITVPTAVNANAVPYKLCWRWRAGAPWEEMTSLVTVLTKAATVLTSVSPKIISNSTAPVLTFTNLFTASIVRIGIAAPGGCGGAMIASAVASANPVVFGAPLPTSITNLAVCLSVDSGATYSEQTLLSLTLTQDPLATAVTSITPRFVGRGTPPIPTLVTSGPSVPLTTLAFTLTSCQTPAARVSAVNFTGPSQTVNVVVPSASGAYGACYAQAPYNAFSTQAAAASTLYVVSATATSIASVSPSVIGSTAFGSSLSMTAAVDPALGSSSTLACRGCRIAFSPAPSTCSVLRVGVYTLPDNSLGTVGGTMLVPMTSALGVPTVGMVFKTCFSSDNGTTWIDQPATTVTIITATAGTLTSWSPQVVGAGVPALPTFVTGPTVSDFTIVGLSLSSTCVGIATSSALQSSLSFTLDTTALSAGLYYICLSVDSGASYVRQTAANVTVLTATATSVTLLAPRLVGSDSVASLNITGAAVRVSPFTAVAFVPVASPCSGGGLVGLTILDTTLVNAAFTPISVFAQTNMTMCFTVTYGTPSVTWVAQTNPASQLLVETPRATSIVAISPAIWAVGFPAVVSIALGGGSFVPASTMIAFAPVNCALGLVSPSAVSPVSYTATLSTPIAASGSYRVCLSVDYGSSWVLLSAGVVATAIEIFPGTVSDFQPSIVGAGTSPLFTVTGLALSSYTQLAFAPAPSICTGLGGTMTFNESSAFNSRWTVPLNPAASTTYDLCVSYNGGLSWVRQDTPGVSLRVEAAAVNAIQSLSPLAVGVSIGGGALVATGPNPTATSQLAFARPPITCAMVGSLVGVSSITTSLTTILGGGGISPAGNFTVCYSVNAGISYTAQSQVRLQGISATAGDVIAFAPPSIPDALANLQITLTFAPTLMLTLTSRMGLGKVGGGGCAAGIGNIYAVTMVTGTVVTLSAPIAVQDDYELCFSSNGLTWAAQAITPLVVAGAKNTSLTAASVNTIDTNLLLPVAFTGAVVSNNSRIAFINYGFPPLGLPTPLPEIGLGCADPGNFDGGLTFAITAPGPVNIRLPFDGIHVPCYSVNGGASYVLQTLPAVRVAAVQCTQYLSCAECNAAPTCSFCIGTQTCSAAVNCSSADAICPNNSTLTAGCIANVCPSISTPAPIRAVFTGGSPITITGSYFNPYLNYTCRLAITSTFFVKLALATYQTPTTISCVLPASELSTTLGGSLTVVMADSLVPYQRVTAPGNAIPVVFYDCGAVSTCSGCYTAERPECGFCVGSLSCTAPDLCPLDTMQLWLGLGVCPLITAVSPAIAPAEGGTALTLTISNVASWPDLACAFDAVRTNVTALTATTAACLSPAMTSGGPAVLSLQSKGRTVANAGEGVSFAFSSPRPIPKPAKPALSTSALAGLVVGVCLLLILIALAVALLLRRNAQAAVVKPPELTDALREQIIYGAPAVLSADDKKRLPHLDDFFNRLVMNEEFTALLGEATAATEQDKLTKCVNVVYETRGRSLDLLLFQVSREVRTSYSQSTLFRTNSFATKLFKMFSKMHGLDYVHSILGRTLNELLLDVSDAAAKATDLRQAKSGDGDAALTRFAMLTKAQRLFQQIQKTEGRLPIEFRYLFRHVQTCLRERFPVRTEDLAEVISSSLLENLSATTTSFSDGTAAFELISTLQSSMSGDMNQLAAVLGPVSGQLENFEAAMKDVVSQVNKMNKVVGQLQGAVDPRSTQAQALIAQHSAKQNSIAIGGFFFLRFLVPCLTAPEAYALVHDVPDTEQRKLLVVLGKVVQNLSNGLEFGAKEAHMVQFNDFIVENQGSMNALFDKLAAIPASAPSIKSLHENAMDVPRKRYDEAIAFIYAHTLSVLDKLGELLQTQTGDKAVDGEHRLLLQILRECVQKVEREAGTLSSEGLNQRMAALADIANRSQIRGIDSMQPGSFASFNSMVAAAGVGGGAGAGPATAGPATAAPAAVAAEPPAASRPPPPLDADGGIELLPV